MLRGIMLALAAVVTMAGAAPAQEGMGPRQQRGRALEGMIESSGDASLHRFAETQLAPSYRASFNGDSLLVHLRAIREAAHGFGGVMADVLDDGATRLAFVKNGGEVAVVFRLEEEAPHLIVALDLDLSGASAAPAEDDAPPYTWDTLAERLDGEARNGFSGSVLVVHDGKVVLERGYGLADRAAGRPITPETIFAIGSVPIDFTKAAVLRLEEMGKLRTSDPITRFIDHVPADKRAITIDQLMTGRSGLPDFFHIPGVDADPDLSWIDRGTAIERLMGQDLLFTPGTDQAHSHGAWVLLAAIVEMASGQSYGDFLRQHFFEPAGMTRTGLHEDMMKFTDRDLAIGYDAQSYGEINTPRHWGRTSWLVMGSGGMASTPRDLYRWMKAIRDGRTLSAQSARRYWFHGVLAGGDDRGFLCVYTEGPDNLMIVCANANARRGDVASKVARRLAALVR